MYYVQELMALVVGNENYNWELLEANCEYKEGYAPDHPTIQHFWKAFRLAQNFVHMVIFVSVPEIYIELVELKETTFHSPISEMNPSPFLDPWIRN